MEVTFLTGASSGIGRSLAKRLAADGDAVALVARRKELLDSLVAEIEGEGGRALTIVCDVTDPVAVTDAVRAAEAHFGPITRLVANAGGGGATPIEPFEAQQLASTFALNVLGVAHCVEAVLPGMLARGRGHLVATSSLAGYRGIAGAAAYSASKAALSNLMESLRGDLRPRGIDVTLIEPGFVNTRNRKKKRNRPFRMELEPATERIHRAIVARAARCAFPASLVALAWLGRLLPARVYDRVLAGRGPRAKPKAARS